MILKVCGITIAEDARAAVEGGATALGFNFYPASPRYVAPERAAAIAQTLPRAVLRVGVFVNEAPERIADIAQLVSLDVVQLHGDETPAEYPRGMAVWKAARVGAEFDWTAWRDCPADALLLDGPAAELYGGVGKSFDWRLAAAAGRRIILAGGLDATNVARAIEMARPWGVDACSRIESAPGRKDHARMIEFLNAAREALSSCTT